MPEQRRPLLKSPAEMVTVAIAGLIIVATVATGTGMVGKRGPDDVSQTSTSAPAPGTPGRDQYLGNRSAARGSVDPWTWGNGSRRTSPQSTGPTTGSSEDFVDILSPWLSETPPATRGRQPGAIPAPTGSGTTTPAPAVPTPVPTSPVGSATGGGSTGTTPPPASGTPTPSGSGTSSPSTSSTPAPTPTTPTSPGTGPTSGDTSSPSPTPHDTPSGTTSTGASPSSGTSDAQTGASGGTQSSTPDTSTPSGAPLAQAD